MTAQGIVVLDLLGILALLWVLNLTRLGRLYVGYGVLFVITILCTIVTVSVPQLSSLVGRAVGAFFPTSGLMVVGFALVVLMLVYILTQVTVLANRLSTLVQEISIQQASRARADEHSDATREVRPSD